MPTTPKHGRAVIYRGTMPIEWMDAIEEYREEHGLTESELVRAAFRSLIGKKKLPVEHVRSSGRQPGEAWHGTST